MAAWTPDPYRRQGSLSSKVMQLYGLTGSGCRTCVCRHSGSDGGTALKNSSRYAFDMRCNERDESDESMEAVCFAGLFGGDFFMAAPRTRCILSRV